MVRGRSRAVGGAFRFRDATVMSDEGLGGARVRGARRPRPTTLVMAGRAPTTGPWRLWEVAVVGRTLMAGTSVAMGGGGGGARTSGGGGGRGGGGGARAGRREVVPVVVGGGGGGGRSGGGGNEGCGTW